MTAPMDWKFSDSPNVAVFTTRGIADGSHWIARVSHDEEDGAWQFHSKEKPNESDAAIVSLREIYDIDPSIGELTDLPLGGRAWRETRNSPWKKDKA